MNAGSDASTSQEFAPAGTTATIIADMLRPPINRAMRQLDRAFFTKHIPFCAARITNNQNIPRLQKELERSKDLFRTERLRTVQWDPDKARAEKGGKCLLLRSGISIDGSRDAMVLSEWNGPRADGVREDPSTWSPLLKQRVEEQQVGLIPYLLELNYDHWTYRT